MGSEDRDTVLSLLKPDTRMRLTSELQIREERPVHEGTTG